MARETETIIGTWIEREAREITQCPSSYAADTETLRTKPGEYPIIAKLSGFGVWTPERGAPYWLIVRIDADRIAGRTYSGFGGMNFSSRDLPLEPKPYAIQANASAIANWLDADSATLSPEFAETFGAIAAQSREITANVKRRSQERQAAHNVLGVYLSMRMNGSGHDYASQCASQHSDQPEPSEELRLAGDYLAGVFTAISRSAGDSKASHPIHSV